jgi:hypothetical protein
MDGETVSTEVEMQKIVEIGGIKYVIQHQDPEKAWDLGIRLMKIVGEPFASMAPAADDEKEVGRILPAAVKALMSNIDSADTLSLIKGVLAGTSTLKDKENLQGAHFKLHFRGKLGHLMKVFTAATEFQFEDFFSAIGDGIADVLSKASLKKKGKE